jgi:hypothetical protein
MNEWVWSTGGMILTGETEVLGEKHYTASVVDEWTSMEHWWNATDRGNWSTGRKALYSVGSRWMNECGALMECYWQGKTEVQGEKPIPVPLHTRQIPHGLARDWTHWPPKPWHGLIHILPIMDRWADFRSNSYPLKITAACSFETSVLIR